MYHAIAVEEVVGAGRREHGIGAVSEVNAAESRRKLTHHLEIMLNGAFPNWGEVASELNGGVEGLGEVQLVDKEVVDNV